MAIIPLPGTVQAAAAGLSGFDVNSILSADQAQDFKNAGYDFCIRYVPRTQQALDNSDTNITNAEAIDILNAGLALMAVQHVADEGWSPTADLGTAYGTFGASYASDTVGLPAGMNLWLDLEGVANGTPTQDVIDYCQAWYHAVKAAGYVPGVYVGWDAGLNAQQLYQNLSFQHYWQAYNGGGVAVRGYQLVQALQKTLNGLDYDPDTTQNDNKGGTVLWLSTGIPA